MDSRLDVIQCGGFWMENHGIQLFSGCLFWNTIEMDGVSGMPRTASRRFYKQNWASYQSLQRWMLKSCCHWTTLDDHRYPVIHWKGLEKHWFWLAISFRNLHPWIVTTSIFCVFRSFIMCQLARDQFWIEHLSPNIWPIIPRAMNWKIAWWLRDRWIFVAYPKKNMQQNCCKLRMQKKTKKSLP